MLTDSQVGSIVEASAPQPTDLDRWWEWGENLPAGVIDIGDLKPWRILAGLINALPPGPDQSGNVHEAMVLQDRFNPVKVDQAKKLLSTHGGTITHVKYNKVVGVQFVVHLVDAREYNRLYGTGLAELVVDVMTTFDHTNHPLLTKIKEQLLESQRRACSRTNIIPEIRAEMARYNRVVSRTTSTRRDH